MLGKICLYISFIFSVVFISSCNYAKDSSDTKRILFVGDLLLDRGVRERIEYRGIDNLFHSTIDSVFSFNDVVVANLECPVTEIEAPINKKYIFL